MGFIVDHICADGLESLHLLNLHNLILGDESDNSDEVCKEKSEMLFKIILPICDKSTRLNVGLQILWITENMIGDEEFLQKLALIISKTYLKVLKLDLSGLSVDIAD